MPIVSKIAEQGFVVHQTVTDPWTADDLIQAGDFEKKHIESVAHTVHVLVDFSGSRRVPGDVLQLRREPSTQHPRFGWMAFVGTASWLRPILTLSLRVMHFNRYVFCQAEADAWRILRQKIAASM